MSIQTKVSANRQTPSEIADSLNRQFSESNQISLSDFNKQIFYCKVQIIAKNVIGTLAGGFSLWTNPVPTIIGGLFSAAFQGYNMGTYQFKYTPKFEVNNNQVVQVNEKFTQELTQNKIERLGIVWFDIICTGTLALSVLYTKSIPGGAIIPNILSFYLGIRALDEAYFISRRLFI